MPQLQSMLLLFTAFAINLAMVQSTDVCRADHALLSATSAGGSSYPTPKSCEDGPARIIHTVHNEFHWPPIYRGSCRNLKCKDPPCIARKKVWRTRCVLVFKKIFGYWVKIGFRIRRFLDELKCSCKQCSDITTQSQCVRTKPCPNQKNPNYFCFWKPGKCDCCIPRRCPAGQIFDRASCSCVCPKGSKLEGGKCIGDCADISLNYCKFVTCEDNRFFKCYVNKDRKCRCPSCDAQKNPFLCPRTRCLELRNNPYCVYDKYDKECRCPQCQDISSKTQCLNSNFCFGSKCKYNIYSRKCFCPH